MSSKTILLTLTLVVAIAGSHGTIQKLEDGLLVTKLETVNSVAVEYSVVITIQSPKFPKELLPDVRNVRKSIG